jgi:hypothetical protein
MIADPRLFAHLRLLTSCDVPPVAYVSLVVEAVTVAFQLVVDPKGSPASATAVRTFELAFAVVEEKYTGSDSAVGSLFEV